MEFLSVLYQVGLFVSYFLVGNLGQIADIILNCTKNAPGLKENHPDLTQSTPFGTVLKYYARSRSEGIWKTAFGLFMVSLLFSIGAMEWATQELGGIYAAMFGLGWGGQEIIRSFLSVFAKKSTDKLLNQGK